MQVRRLFFTLIVLLSLLLPSLSPAQGGRVVSIPDANLAAAIRQEIGDSITTQTLLNLTRLIARNRGITDLTGLEHAHNLRQLELNGEFVERKGDVNSNAISDISALAKLTKLTSLFLSDNAISDISALAKLTKLTSLSLSDNAISDISALAKLTELTELWLGGNGISDISSLSGLTQLKALGLTGNNIKDVSSLSGLTQLISLWLGGNGISDVSSLSGLTQLKALGLTGNAISDISPLVRLDLPGTKWNTTGLSLWNNPLSYISLNTHIPAMQSKGIEIDFESRTPTKLVSISDAAQQGIVNTALPLPLAVEVYDENNRVFAGVPVTFAITTGNGRLSTTKTTTDVTGRATTRLTLGRTAGTITTVSVTAAEISQPVQFTATAILRGSPVAIPDANLRARIMETLRKPRSETPTAADMLKLTRLTANNSNIRSLTGLQHAAHLETLVLENNHIFDVAPLAGLTQLTRLVLESNRISDVAPLAGLTQLTTLDIRNNSLSDTAIHTHIPSLQTAGVNVRFDSIVRQQEPIVRLIYCLPRDRQPDPDIDAKMDTLIKDVQQFYAEQMKNHGYGRKTFQFETDARGNAVVYHIKGKFDDAYYHDESGIVWEEINEQFDSSKNIYFTALDLGSQVIGRGEYDLACGTGGGGSHSGQALIPASGPCFNFEVAAHELGHAFGLRHDFRNDSYIMSYGVFPNKVSQCAAEWLDVHRALNASQVTSNEWAAVEMLPPSFVSSPNVIRLRFKVTDLDGLHQAQLQTGATEGDPAGGLGHPKLLGCKSLKGKNSTVEFVTSLLTPRNEAVHLEVIDVNGNFTRSQDFPVNISLLLPPPKVVSIPDANLAAAIRQEIGDSITTQTLLNLTRLIVRNRVITDLTGLEHALNLSVLDLDRGFVEGEEGINSNAILDISALAKLTKLRRLWLGGNRISDISSLSGLTQLTLLWLGGNAISDISALAKLTELTELWLDDTGISDISALAKLTQLTSLSLGGNAISDVSALAKLTELTELWLGGNAISDVSALSGLTQLTLLSLGDNAISDISALSGLTQLTSLSLGNNAISDISPLIGLNLTGTEWDSTGLYLERNPLSYASIHTHIPAMQAKGIEVRFDNTPAPRLTTDVNGDGVVNIQDLVLVSSNFGQTGEKREDVNGDGVVNIADLVLVAGAFGDGGAAPTLHPRDLEGLSAAEIQHLLTQARQIALTSPTALRGISVLEQLLAFLLPKETTLLPNYPNPFNPETWIPYQLAKPVNVTLHIYSVNGTLVRTLVLGHQQRGVYHSKSCAAYWDGRNEQGERVVSGVYFYTLSAGDFTATRKMLIRK